VTAIDGRTRLVGVMGWPIEHTLSPTMHNAAFEAAGLNWRYVPLAVPPECVGDAVQGLRAMGFAGCNVTVPHKQAVMQHLDRITEEARAIGAVNTIVIGERQYSTGHNTDALGFLKALAEGGFRPAGKRAVVLGAGGAARALVYALASRGASVAVLNRTLSHAESLVAGLSSFLSQLSAQPVPRLRALPLTLRALQEEILSADLLVNATSLGMWPNIGHSPWPEELGIPSRITVFDAVYNPAETKLLRQARVAGAHTIGGLTMLVHQGAKAWELWTQQEPPVAAMAAAASEAFSSRGPVDSVDRTE
jgi:shikimate dehydrogenase